MLALDCWSSRFNCVWAAVRAADTESALAGRRVYWVRERSASRPLGVLHGLVEARRILRLERPGAVVSAGSGVAVPFFLAAYALAIPTIWISTLNVIRAPGLAARVCSRLASLVLLQRETLLHDHPRGIVIGELY